jgi:hypothetical protein
MPKMPGMAYTSQPRKAFFQVNVLQGRNEEFKVDCTSYVRAISYQAASCAEVVA